MIIIIIYSLFTWEVSCGFTLNQMAANFLSNSAPSSFLLILVIPFLDGFNFSQFSNSDLWKMTMCDVYMEGVKYWILQSSLHYTVFFSGHCSSPYIFPPLYSLNFILCLSIMIVSIICQFFIYLWSLHLISKTVLYTLFLRTNFDYQITYRLCNLNLWNLELG